MRSIYNILKKPPPPWTKPGSSKRAYTRISQSICSCFLSDEEEDSDEINICIGCSQERRNVHIISDLDEESKEKLSCYLTDDTPDSLETKLICDRCLNILNNADTSDVKDDSGRHSPACQMCEKSLLISNTPVTSTNFLVFPEVEPEYSAHRHFPSVVSPLQKHFVSFALRLKHKSTGNRPTLGSCLCLTCHRDLLRKFEKARKNDWSFSHPPARKRLRTSSCDIPGCEQDVHCSIQAVDSVAATEIFACDIQAAGEISVCLQHYMVFYNSQQLCLLCSKRMRKGEALRTPTVDSKTDFLQKLQERDVSTHPVLPDDFIHSEYRLHTKCWLKSQNRVKKAPIKSGDTAEAESGSSVFEEPLYSSIEDTADSSAVDEIFEIVEDEAAAFKSEDEVEDEVDQDILKYIERRLREYTFSTRKEIQDKFNEIQTTKRFSNNLPPVGNIRGDPLQRRILRKWSQVYTEPDQQLTFTFCSNKSGYLVHLANVNVFQYIASVHKKRIEESGDLYMNDSEPASILSLYMHLLEKIEENAKAIDSYYISTESGQMNVNFSLELLFEKISPAVFNFVVFLTLSSEERQKVLRSPHLPAYLSGELHIMEIYNQESPKSHSLFVKRIFLSIELIFLRVRGKLCNPFSLCIADLGKISFLMEKMV